MERHPRKTPSPRNALRPTLERLDDRIVPAPVVLDRNLTVSTVTSGLALPVGMAFLGDSDMLVIEKNSGQVKRVVNGTVTSTVLDLAVNNSSERGLLSIALHPDFPENPSVYLYWTESTTGADTNVLSETPLLGNRVDRFVWDGSTLTMAENIIQLRAIQNDATNGRERGNHDGGVIRFGPDGKLYIFIGDVGRRGWMQNLGNGPFSPGDPLFGTDDQFGGPEPDDAHLSSVILRLNDDGSTPDDNPFMDIGHVFVARLDGSQENPANSSTAKGYALFFLDRDMTALSFTVTVADLDFTGSQTADTGDDLVAAHIHAPGAPGTNAGVRFGFFGLPFNDTNPNDVVVTTFTNGVGGTITSKWDLTEGNNTTLAAQLPNILAGLSYINFHTREFPGGEIRGQILENTEVTENLHKVFSYGHRNGFGMAFDPVSGSLWLEENSDDSFSELNRIEPGMNGGWVQIMGPVSRIDQFKATETSPQFFGLQQVRWSPENIADSPEEALDSLFEVPGSHYSDPEFSWRFEVAPGGIGFMEGSALGPQYRNDLFMGAATPILEGGYLFHFNLTGNRQKIGVDDPRLNDRVADNVAKHEITESESLLFGTGFGIVTDIKTGPNGNLFVVSLSDGNIYEIERVKARKVRVPMHAATPTLNADAILPRPVLHLAPRVAGVAGFPAQDSRPQGQDVPLKRAAAHQHVLASDARAASSTSNGPAVDFLFGGPDAGELGGQIQLLGPALEDSIVPGSVGVELIALKSRWVRSTR